MVVGTIDETENAKDTIRDLEVSKAVRKPVATMTPLGNMIGDCIKFDQGDFKCMRDRDSKDFLYLERREPIGDTITETNQN